MNRVALAFTALIGTGLVLPGRAQGVYPGPGGVASGDKRPNVVFILADTARGGRQRVGSRGRGEVSTGANHLGFRCVRSPNPS